MEVLENFLHALELLPKDLRRDFTLIWQLDRDSVETNRDLVPHEGKILTEKGGTKRKISELALNEMKSRRSTSMMKQNEKVAVAINILSSVGKYMRRIDNDLLCFENFLEASTNFESLGADPGTEVAIRPDCYDDGEWILGRVIKFYKDTGYYDIADIDDSEKKHFISEAQVLILPLNSDVIKRLGKGEDILAVYPETTSFYPAIVATSPKKVVGTDTIGVQFLGDYETFGQSSILPTKSVPTKYIIRVRQSDNL